MPGVVPSGLEGGALEADAQSQRAGGRGSQPTPTQGNDLDSPRCCSKDGSKTIWGTQAAIGRIFIYALKWF